ncbi:putative ribonuclease H-like domain-containing protein [Tanacetum coccineum]
MRVIGHIGKYEIHILVDSGSTHNFIDYEIARKLGRQMKKTCPLQVTVTNGNLMVSSSMCRVKWKLKNEEFYADMMVLPLGGCEMVLGIQWLSTLVDITCNFQELKMRFVYNDKVMAAAKLPILNPQEFDLWKIRIEQYFLMTDYALWEVILNGDSAPPTRVVDGVEQPFNSHKDAKSLMEAIEKRFGGNTETKKVQKTLLKQQYENFTGSSSESLDKIYDRLQKLISQLEIHGETISQEDVNLKLLRNEVKGSPSSTLNTQNKAFVSSNNTSSTIETVNTAHSVPTANTTPQASSLPNVDSVSDAVIYSFFASQSNSPQLDNEDLKQIDPDDLEEMDLKWLMAMFTMRARRFLKKTGRNLGPNGTATIGFDMSKVECYNCHRRGHFARECRSPRDNKNKNLYQAEDAPSDFALMAYTSSSSLSTSGSYNKVSHCSKASSYQTGLESVETRLEVYKKNEAIFEEDIKILKLDVVLRDNALTELRKKFEKAERERDELKLTLEKFQSSSKNLSKLLESQISDKSKSGLGFDNQVFSSEVFDTQELNCQEFESLEATGQELNRYKIGEGYHAVPHPYTGNFMPPKPDLIFPKVNAVNESKPKSINEPIIEDWVSDDEEENVSKPSVEKINLVTSTQQTVKPSVVKEESVNAKQPEQTSRKNINFNHLINDCEFHEKKMAQKPVWNNAMRVNPQNKSKMTHPHPIRDFVPAPVLTKSGLVSISTAKPNVSKAVVLVNTAKPVNTAVTKPPVNCARSVNTAKGNNVTTTGPKSVVNDVQGKEVNDVKASACWVWKPKQKVIDHVFRLTGASMSFKRFDYTDAQDFKEINGGYVAFGGDPKGGKITGKGRKAHLLEDKQIPSVGVFDEVFLALGWHLENLHVTWAHLEKKRTRLQTYTKTLGRKALRAWRRRLNIQETPSGS